MPWIALLLAAALLAVPDAADAAPPSLFPSDRLTVADPSQVTGRRVALPLPDCSTRPSDCNEIRLLNELDGFDLDPRVKVRFGRPIDVARVNAETLYLEPVAGGERIGLNRLVFSPARNTLFGQPTRQLAAATTYRLVVTPAVGGEGAQSTFTTMSATTTLATLRDQLDDGSAYDAAGIGPAERGLEIVRRFPAAAVAEMTRFNDTGAEALESEPVINTARLAAGEYVFGSFQSPQWLDAEDRSIEQVPSGRPGPAARRSERVGFVLILPATPRPAGGYPVAIFGPGITRSKYDIFLAADENASRGIATIAIDPVGHSFGPRGVISVNGDRFPQFGRAVDVDGDGRLTQQEGVQSPSQPHPKASIGLRDGLRQTALDQMALVRAIERSAGELGLRPSGISYYAISLGGIYGTQFAATDPKVEVSAHNVPGGPILEIARLAPGFRPRVADELGARVPSLLNGGCEGFTESQPLYIDPPVLRPAQGAVAIQEVGARTNWLNRPGSPEAYAPAIARERVFYQFAFGDQTVPNPTSATLVRAGNLLDRTTFYRNDRTPSATMNPHGGFEDPRIAGRSLLQRQVVEFLATDGRNLIDPDGAASVFEVPIADPLTLERLNFAFPCLGSNAPPAEAARDDPKRSPAARGSKIRLRVVPRRLVAGRTARLLLRTTVRTGTVRARSASARGAARERPLAGVRVRVAGRVRVTDRRGVARIRVRPRRPGRLVARASRAGFRSDRQTIRVGRAPAPPRFTG